MSGEDRPPPVGRLLKRDEFKAAARGRRFGTDRMGLQGRMRKPGETADAGLRVGFTLTRKVGHATERNRIRRRLRAATAEASAGFAARSVDVVVLGRRDALSAPFPVLVDDLSRGLAAVTRPPEAGGRPGRGDPAGRRRGPALPSPHI